MDRKKALLTSTIVAATVMVGAVAFAASSDLTDSPRDNVGKLQPAVTAPALTIVVDPTTGAAAVSSTTAVPATLATSTNGQHEGQEHHEDEEEVEESDD